MVKFGVKWCLGIANRLREQHEAFAARKPDIAKFGGTCLSAEQQAVVELADELTACKLSAELMVPGSIEPELRRAELAKLKTAMAPLDEETERQHCFHLAEKLTGYPWTAPRVSEEIMCERAAARAECEVKVQGLLARIQKHAKDRLALQDLLESAQVEIERLKAAMAPMDEATEQRHCIEAVQRCAETNGVVEEMVERERAAVRGGKNLELARVREELATAQAEIQDLRDEQLTVCCGEYGTGSGQHSDECAFTELESKLSAAQAEIERLKRDLGDADELRLEVYTQLTNLRAVVERASLRLLTTNQHKETAQAVARELDVAHEASR